MGQAFSTFTNEINNIMVGYANVFFQRQNYDCVILETITECYCFKGDFEKARSYLKDAVSKAVRYDLAAPGDVADMKFLSPST